MSALVPLNLDHPTYQLPGDSYYHLMYTLRRALPHLETDDPEALRRRDHAAIARVAGLVPVNAAEADVAGLYVAASEQWKQCLYEAQLPGTSLKVAMQCRAQANSMMRQAQGALRLLLRMQAVREKRESTNRSCDSAAMTEECAIDLMLKALGSPEPAAQPQPEPLSDPAATAHPEPPQPTDPEAEAQPAPPRPQPAHPPVLAPNSTARDPLASTLAAAQTPAVTPPHRRAAA